MAFTFNPTHEQFEREMKQIEFAIATLRILAGIVIILGVIGIILVWI